MASPTRRLLASVVAALASAALLLTMLAHYVDHMVVSRASFASHATSVLRSESVNALIVTRVTDDVAGKSGDGGAVRPIISAAVRDTVQSRAVTSEFRSTADQLHTGLLSGTATRITLSLPDVGATIAAAIESKSPALAGEVRGIGTITLIDDRIPSKAASAIHGAASISEEWPELLLLSAALIVLALLISPLKRRTLVGLGLRGVASGLLVVVLYFIGREVIAGEFSGHSASVSARAVWTIYLGGLKTQALILAVVGGIVAGAGVLLRSSGS